MRLNISISASNEGIRNIKNMILPFNKNIQYIISHQVLKNNKYNFDINRKDIIFKQINSKGLSKNRNSSINLTNNEICLISDDDVRFKEEIQEIVLKAFENNPSADNITFKFLLVV